MGSKLIIATVIVQNSSTVTLSSRVEKKIKGNHKHLSIKIGYRPIRQQQTSTYTYMKLIKESRFRSFDKWVVPFYLS